MKLNYTREQHDIIDVEGRVPYLTFPKLADTGLVTNAFSTRFGGVSTGHYATMNFNSHIGDDPAAVLENFTRFGEAIGVRTDQMVKSQQTHTTNLRVVTEEDLGKGVLRSRRYKDVDGLVTNIPGICLVTSSADCVTLYFVDPKHRAIALSHSGWRGTVAQMGEATIRKMQELYGTDPADLITAIGPSICQDCYEVSEDVIDRFKEVYEPSLWPEIFRTGRVINGENPEQKYHLDLWAACRATMLRCGVKPENIAMANLCTCCNADVLYSHRASAGKRGELCAFLMLKED